MPEVWKYLGRRIWLVAGVGNNMIAMAQYLSVGARTNREFLNHAKTLLKSPLQYSELEKATRRGYYHHDHDGSEGAYIWELWCAYFDRPLIWHRYGCVNITFQAQSKTVLAQRDRLEALGWRFHHSHCIRHYDAPESAVGELVREALAMVGTPTRPPVLTRYDRLVDATDTFSV